ncbi:MAG: PIG-L family deacetylase [Victivallaceae bacterium]|nr:PIG-L family deacetylase [Victivallaceae bacterium]
MKKKIITFSGFAVRNGATVAVLAPHPDDFDAIAVTLKRLACKGANIILAVMTGGASGVEDSFGSFTSDTDKAQLREAEQLDSCRLFGLADDAVTFLRLAEADNGNLLANRYNQLIIEKYLKDIKPEVIFMPHGNDTNATHRASLIMVKRAVAKLHIRVNFMLNMDPKTIAIEPDYSSGFEDDEAKWKGALLRCHKSQHQRNLNTRQHGFDYRILEFNRQGATKFKLPVTYAELFELEVVNE